MALAHNGIIKVSSTPFNLTLSLTGSSTMPAIHASARFPGRLRSPQAARRPDDPGRIPPAVTPRRISTMPAWTEHHNSRWSATPKAGGIPRSRWPYRASQPRPTEDREGRPEVLRPDVRRSGVRGRARIQVCRGRRAARDHLVGCANRPYNHGGEERWQTSWRTSRRTRPCGAI